MARLTGVIVPLLTPFEHDGAIADDLWVSHANRMLEQGAHYLSPFGTTGEALSVSVNERKHALDRLVEAGISAACLMPGTGVTSLLETLELSRHAAGLGCAAIMVLPSFFCTQAVEDGHFRYFSELIENLGDACPNICLYNIPQNSGVAVMPSLTARLKAAFPNVITAYKDSSGDWENTIAVIKAAPEISVFPGSESLLTRGLEAGGAGCISATLNLNARAIRDVFDAKVRGRDVSAIDADIKAFRKIVQDADLIPAMKAVLAAHSNDSRWLNTRAPLLNATMEKGKAVLAQLGALAPPNLQ